MEKNCYIKISSVVFGRKSLTAAVLLSIGIFPAQWAHGYSNQEFSQVISPQEARIDQFRNAEIEQLSLVLSRSAATEKEPELMLRLAELYTEKYRLFFFKENEIWNRKIDAYLQLPLERQRITKKPVLDGSASRGWLVKAVKVLQRIPLQKGGFERIDEVYYFLGFNLWELGKKKLAVDSFEKIIESYPRSKFSSEAYRYVADFSFAERDFRRSRDLYEKAAKTVDSPARPRILYGLAWSLFKLKEYKRAVSTMKTAIELGKENPDAARAGLALQRDAADSLALFYSEGGKVNDAAAFFNDLFGESDGPTVLRKLAEIYQRQGEYPKALAINKQLLSMGGSAAKEGEEQRFALMVDSLNISTSGKDRAKQAALLKTMTAEFVTNSRNSDPEKKNLLMSQVRKAATLSHKEAGGARRDGDALRRAEDLYRLYLSAFGSSIRPEDGAEIHFYLADVLSQRGNHREAAEAYRTILERSNSESAYGKYKKDAAAGMVYSLNEFFKSKKSRKEFAKAESDQLIGAIDSFVDAYPRDKDSPKYLARATGILVTSSRMEEARPRLKELIEKYPNSKEAWDAAANLLKDAEDRKQYDEAEKLSRSFLENRNLIAQDQKGEFRKKLESILAKAQFQQVKEVEEDKNYSSAASGYEKLAAETKDPEVKGKALNNAAINFQKAGDRENQIRIYKQILQENSGNGSAEENILAIGNEHFLSGRYEAAAGVYEEFFKVYETKLTKLPEASQKKAMEAIRSAALLRRALDQDEKASENFRKIVDAANRGIGSARDTAGEFLFDLAKRLKDENNIPEAIRSFQKYSSVFPDGQHSVGALMETALLYKILKEEEKNQNYLRATISKTKAKTKPSAEDLAYGARARLALLEPLEHEFEKSTLRLPEAQLKKDINSKLAALERLNKGYIEVMDFGDGAWGVEAFRRMALVYRSFGNALESAPVPPEYSSEDKAKFKAQLRNVARPVYVKVGETLESVIQKGEQLYVVGPSMAKGYLLAALTAAKPDRLPLVQKLIFSSAREWIMGEIPSGDGELEAKRKVVRSKPGDLNAWIAIGNYHLLNNEQDLAEIFYLYAAQKNPKFPAAINNLAYLKAKEGDLSKAMAGFKTALSVDEFAVAPKKNMARFHMASGLWRHAGHAYRQLEVRLPSDKEVKRGIALAALATGKITKIDASLWGDSNEENLVFAQAISSLASGDREVATNLLKSIQDKNEYAQVVLDFWKMKEISQ